ncbi:hypothetical protein ACFT9I_37475 [Streptomyces sp. NPDC057137]|uniref:hypothetical protein n=1 Tax=Streptomyces sp. NPDC057137 TaxID=3346030 RepID=UPI00362AFADF
MAGETVVKVSWGPRPESHQELAGRWLDLLGRLTELSAGALADWRWDGHGTAPGEPVPRDAGAFVVARQPDGGYAQLKATAGGSNRFSPFIAVVLLFPGTPDSAVPLADRLPEALAAMAGVWDADTGSTYDRELFTALRTAYDLRPSHPRCGWSVFLSANRAARVPTDLAARRLEAGSGGVVLDIGTTTDAVLAAHGTLAEAGALEPAPTPWAI